MPNLSPLWSPDRNIKNSSRLLHFSQWLEQRTENSFDDYQDLWKYSVENIEDFWQNIADYFQVMWHTKPTAILEGGEMPNFTWFPGGTLNYAEHIFRHFKSEETAIIFKHEGKKVEHISWKKMRSEVIRLIEYFQSLGLKKGDCVVGFLPNIPHASYAFLAACSMGIIWSSASPDFGADSIVDRFGQIKPKVLFAADGYTYNGKPHSKLEVISELAESLNTVEKIIVIPFLENEPNIQQLDKAILYSDIPDGINTHIEFTPVDFSHPIWVLYSSGTTGTPKAITHSHGGCLLEHLKYLAFHNDVKEGEKFFWFSTTGWMMWNYLHGALLHGSSIVLYEGSVAYPNLDALWQLVADEKIEHFGTSAPYIVACMKRDVSPNKFDLSGLRSINSTGAPLPPDGFKYIYEKVKLDVWLVSMSGGTDVCTAFVGGNITKPVYEGEIQCIALGVRLEAYDEEGQSVVDEIGEMVITKPMPSMPIFFWNDVDKKRYLSSYFEMYPNIWRHGDWIKITERNGILIYGRSDATLNRQGVRIGTAEVYRAVDKVSEIKDSIIVNIEQLDGSHYMPLFVIMNVGQLLNDEIKNKIKRQLKKEYSPRHVPDKIFAVKDIPYTISGKKMEAPLKKVLMGKPVEKSINKDAMRNPECIDYFLPFIQT